MTEREGTAWDANLSCSVSWMLGTLGALALLLELHTLRLHPGAPVYIPRGSTLIRQALAEHVHGHGKWARTPAWMLLWEFGFSDSDFSPSEQGWQALPLLDNWGLCLESPRFQMFVHF